MSSYPPYPPRFNIVFHGVMVFREHGRYYRVLIPPNNTAGHEAWFATSPPKDLQPLPPGCWVLEGVAPCTTVDCRPPSQHHLILRNRLLLDGPGIGIEIRVPKPDMIRGFRAVEMRPPITDPAIGDPSHLALHYAPDVLYEAVMFSYTGFSGDYNPRLVYASGSPRQGEEPEHCYVVGNRSSQSTLSIYFEMHDMAFDPGMIAQHRKDHSDMLNALLSVNFPDGTVTPLNLDVYVASQNGDKISDDPPGALPPKMGLDPVHLLNLNELTNKDNLPFLDQGQMPRSVKCGDPSGCTTAFALD